MCKWPWPNSATIPTRVRKEWRKPGQAVGLPHGGLCCRNGRASATDCTDVEQAACIKGHTDSTDVFIRYSKQASINDDRNIKRVTKKVENNCVVSQYTCSPGGLEHVLWTSVTRYLPEQQTAGGSVPMCGLCSVVQQQQPVTAQSVMLLYSRTSVSARTCLLNDPTTRESQRKPHRQQSDFATPQSAQKG